MEGVRGIGHRMVAVNGINMHVAEKGEGPVVLFLHGFPELWYSWRHQIIDLAARGYHAVAPDLRGYGDTDAPPAAASYTILHIVGDLIALIDALGQDKVFVVGHDWGAIVAWSLCLLRPDRVKALVNMSVAFSPRSPTQKTVDMYKALFGEDYYICRFQAVFDVTKYGAVADGKTDNRKPFSDAWKSACKHRGAASLVIPQGTFFVGPIKFQGPCHNNAPPSVEIEGELRAPSSLESIPSVAWIEFRALQGLRVGGGGTVDGQGAEAWDLTKCPKERNCNNLPTSMRFIKVSNATIADLTLLDSKGFHISIQRSAYVMVRRLNISAPPNSHNTDDVHISGTHGIEISDLTIGTGDDCISIGPGSSNISITSVACGPGHGISVGSLGKYKNEKNVEGVEVRNCMVSGTTNGVRIKMWPGSTASQASDVTFEDIVMKNVTNPIIIDQVYCPSHKCGDKPSLVKIRNVTYKRIRGTSKSQTAVRLMCSKSRPCENVKLQDIDLELVASKGSKITSYCSNVNGKGLGTLKPDVCV